MQWFGFVDPDEANKLKMRYGIGKSQYQAQLAGALEPILSAFANEVQKMMRYYRQHSGAKANINELVLVGGGASMPGLGEFLTHLTGINVRVCNPWQNLLIKPLQPPHPTEITIFASAVGLALREFIHD